MVWEIFSWHTLGPLVPIEHRLNTTVYLSIVADHVHPFMTTVHPSSDATSSRIMHHVTKLKSSQTGCLNMTMSSLYLEVKRTEREADLASVFSICTRVQYPWYMQVYTDGSKDPERQTTGAAFLVQGSGYQGISGVKLTSNNLAVYTVEMIGILLALKWVEEHKPENVFICSDSVAVLKSLRSFKIKSPRYSLYYPTNTFKNYSEWYISQFYLGHSTYRNKGKWRSG